MLYGSRNVYHAKDRATKVYTGCYPRCNASIQQNACKVSNVGGMGIVKVNRKWRPLMKRFDST
jgi:hypothetical protein